MTTVITYGTFDLFHYGHRRLLERARDLGDYFIVGVTADNFDKNRGKFDVQQSLMERIESVRATGLADEIIVEEYEGQKIDDIKEKNVDIFTVGSDWRGRFDYLSEYCDIVYLDRTEGVSSTDLRAENRNISLGFVGESRVLTKFYNEAQQVSGIKIETVYTNDVDVIKNIDSPTLKIADCYEDVLYDCDAVVIVSHPSKHYRQVKKALLAGKHVLCESPIALKEEEAEELFQIAHENDLILFESIKTAYSTAYNRLLLLAKTGKIGDILSIDATCTSLIEEEDDPISKWSSIASWGPTALLPIFQLLGCDYEFKYASSLYLNNTNFDLFTKVDFEYEDAVASIKVGNGVKSEGELIISGTEGYIYVPAPWWKTDYFELRYENPKDNQKYFYQLEGEGIRYELVAFTKSIQINKDNSYIENEVSTAICKIVEDVMAQDSYKINR